MSDNSLFNINNFKREFKKVLPGNRYIVDFTFKKQANETTNLAAKEARYLYNNNKDLIRMSVKSINLPYLNYDQLKTFSSGKDDTLVNVLRDISSCNITMYDYGPQMLFLKTLNSAYYDQQTLCYGYPNDYLMNIDVREYDTSNDNYDYPTVHYLLENCLLSNFQFANLAYEQSKVKEITFQVYCNAFYLVSEDKTFDVGSNKYF